MFDNIKAAYQSLTQRITLRQIVSEELVEAQRKLLVAEDRLEFAQSEVDRRQVAIARLTQRLSSGALIELGDDVPDMPAARRSKPTLARAAS